MKGLGGLGRLAAMVLASLATAVACLAADAGSSQKPAPSVAPTPAATTPTMFGRWNVVGPFDAGVDPSRHPADTPADLSARIDASHARLVPPQEKTDLAAVYKDKAGKEARWQVVEESIEGYVDLSTLYGGGVDWTAACALAYVFSPAKAKYEILAGSDDDIQVRLNGKSVYNWFGWRGSRLGDDRFVVELQQGWNEVLLRVDNRTSGWGFYFQIVDPKKVLKFALKPGDAAGAPPPPVGDPVSEEVLAQIRDRMVDVNAPMDNGQKIRRYKEVLRRGEQAEAKYPTAPNLHVIRGWMVSATEGLATLEGDAQWQEQALKLAQRIVDSNAPPKAKVRADVLVLGSRLAQLQGDKAGVAREALAFVRRYAETDAEPDSLMYAISMLFREEGQRGLVDQWIARLSKEHKDVPGVPTFLRQVGAGGLVTSNRLFEAELKRLDGSTLKMPDDLLGRTVWVHFWSLSAPRVKSQLPFLKEVYDRVLRPTGQEIVGVSLDPSVRDAEKVVKELGLGWIETCSGLGMKDPTLLRYGILESPSWLRITPDGRIMDNETVNDLKPWIENLDRAWRDTLNHRWYRSGQFLLRTPVCQAPATAAPGDVPPEVMAKIRDLILLPPALPVSQQDQRCQEVLTLGAKAEADYPQAANLYVVRNQMMVAAWLLGYDPLKPGWEPWHHRDSDAAAAKIGQRLLAGQTPPEARLLADYFTIVAAWSERLSTMSQAQQADEIASQISAITTRYSQMPVAAHALVVADLQVRETGINIYIPQMAPAMKAVTELERLLKARAEENPIVRGYLRGINWHPDLKRILKMELKRLDGSTLRLPDDMEGKVVVLRFWTVAAAPGLADGERQAGSRAELFGLTPEQAKDVEIVAVSLDPSREDVEKFVKRGKPAWTVVWSGMGWDDPLVRKLDINWVPSTWVIDRSGRISDDDAQTKPLRNAVRGPALQQAPGHRFAKWNVIGPFDTGADPATHPAATVEEQSALINASHARPLPPQANLDLAATYEGKGGKAARWQAAEEDADGYLDLELLYRGATEWAAACALAYVYSPAKAKFEILAGSDDDLQVRLNGKSVYNWFGGRGASLGDDQFSVELQQGWNEVLLRVDNRWGGWGFFFQIVDPKKVLKFALKPGDGIRR